MEANNTAIIAEIRHLAKHRDWHNHTSQSTRERLLYLADHLEASLKREKVEIEADALAAGRIVEAESHKPGNAAKLRDALIKAITMLAVCEWPDGTNMEGVEELRRDIDATLDVPPRNCDVGTAEEQAERFDCFCHIEKGDCGSCPLWVSGTIGHNCELRWAQMPYEEGGEK